MKMLVELLEGQRAEAEEQVGHAKLQFEAARRAQAVAERDLAALQPQQQKTQQTRLTEFFRPVIRCLPLLENPLAASRGARGFPSAAARTPEEQACQQRRAEEKEARSALHRA